MPQNDRSIIFIDDDSDDIALIRDAMAELGRENTVLYFDNAIEALDYFRSPGASPFIVFCDVNMPGMTGFELRSHIGKDFSLVLLTTPFIYLTTSRRVPHESMAYALNAQGYFQKPAAFNSLVSMLRQIIAYWESSVPVNDMRGQLTN